MNKFKVLLSGLTFLVIGLIIVLSANLLYLFIALQLGLGYIALCFLRPKFAVLVLIFSALVVFFSSIKVLNGISALVIIGLSFIACWILRALRGNEKIILITELKYFIPFVLSLFVSTAINIDRLVNFVSLFTYVQLFLLVLIITNYGKTPGFIRSVGELVIWSSFIIGLFIVLVKINLLSSSIVQIEEEAIYFGINRITYQRAAGFFGDPNFTALQLVVSIPFIFEYWEWSPLNRKFLYSVVLLIILAGLFLTYSISGFITFLSIVLIKLFTESRKHPFINYLRIITGGLFLLLILSSFPPPFFQERLSTVVEQVSKLLGNINSQEFLYFGTTRGDIWKATWASILHSPIIGYGPGNGHYFSPRYSILYYKSDYIAAHNFLLSIFNDLGIFGLLSFLLIFGIAIVNSWRTIKRAKGYPFLPTSKAVLITLIAIFIQGMSIDLQQQKILWLMIGLSFTMPYWQGINNGRK